MAFSLTKHQRAQLMIGLLGIVLVVALMPYATGLIGAPVLAVMARPLYRWLRRYVARSIAAGIVVAVAVFAIVVPGLFIAGLVVNEAGQLAGGIIQSPVLGELYRLQIGEIEVGPRLIGLGEAAIQWVGERAADLVGTAASVALNITIAMFGLYFLLLKPGAAWRAVAPYIPFSANNTARLRMRFQDVTNSTIIGTGLTAVVQGTMVGIAFWIAGLPSGFFFGVLTAIFAILPVVGSGLVWGPGAIALFLSGRYAASIALLLWGFLLVASVDNVIRPLVYKKWAKIHPVVTLVGALAGIRFFGILGLLIGPLALSYFFELIVMYRQEYIAEEETMEHAVAAVGEV